MPSFRDQIKTYVDDQWTVPCKDGIVWVYYAAIDTKGSINGDAASTTALSCSPTASGDFGQLDS